MRSVLVRVESSKVLNLNSFSAGSQRGKTMRSQQLKGLAHEKGRGEQQESLAP
jgi:hypothetical protein